MREKLRQIRNKFLARSGFTLVETLISVAIVSVVILSLVATSTFSLSFSRMEKARTLAQDISRNVMSQHVRTVKFADLKNKMGGAVTKSEVLFLALNNSISVNKLGQTSSLSEDLRKLSNSKCELVLRQMSDPNQIDIKVRILWDLDKSGAQLAKTKVVELATITSLGDMNLKRANRIAQAAQGEIPGLDPTICNPACAIDQECVNNVCVTPGACNPDCGAGYECQNGTCVKIITCNPACGTGQECQAGVCVSLPCNPTCQSWQECVNATCIDRPCNPACNATQQCINGTCQSIPCNPACGPDQTCSGGVCIDSCGNGCKSTQFCKQGTCYDRCLDSTECTGRNICTNGLCQPGGTCAGNSDCPYDQICNQAKKQCEVVYCSPTCGINQACIQGQCQTVSCCSSASCTYPKFPCLSGYECKSDTCQKIVNTECKYVDNNTQYVGSCPRTYYCPAPGQGGCKSCNGLKSGRPIGCNCTNSGQCASGTCDPKTKICI